MGLNCGPCPGSSEEEIAQWIKKNRSEHRIFQEHKFWRFLKFVVGFLLYPFLDPLMQLRLRMEILKRETTEAKLQGVACQLAMAETTMYRLDVYLTRLEVPFEKQEWDLRARVEFLLENATSKLMLSTMYKIKEAAHLRAQQMVKDQLEEAAFCNRRLYRENDDLQNRVVELEALLTEAKKEGE